MPRILSELIAALQAQTEALIVLPRTMSDLNTAVRELIAATAAATETVASAQRTAERLEDLVEELEEPVRALRPGLERVGRVLDDPVIDTVPDTLRRISDDLLPLVQNLRQATSRIGAVAGILRRRGRPGDPDPAEGAGTADGVGSADTADGVGSADTADGAGPAEGIDTPDGYPATDR